MANDRPPLLSSHRTWCLLALLLGAVGVYLAAWLVLPLYPDEVALRFDAARADIDGWVRHGLITACPSNIKAIPLLLRPGAMAFSSFDKHFGWDLLRTIPWLLLMAATAMTAWHNRRSRQVLLMCGAFVGVTGGGLILMRPEIFALLHLMLCLVTFYAAARTPARITIALITLAHLFVISLSLMIHLQGLLLLPLSVLSLWRLLHKHVLLAFIVTAIIIALGWQSYDKRQFICAEQPALEAMIAKTQGSATPLIESPKRLTRYVERAERYVRHAMYKRYFNPPYVPAVEGSVKILNVPISLVIIGNALALAGILLLGLRHLWQRYGRTLHRTPWQQTWSALLWDPWVAITGAGLVLAFYAIYDMTGTFYRAFFIHFLTVMLVAFAARLLPQPRLQTALSWLAVLACVTCIASTAVNYVRIVPPLRDGYVGPSTALSTDWDKTARDVATLKQRCAIADDAPRLVADDLSYQALRHHPHLVDLIYVYTDEVILRAKYDDATANERLEKIRAIKPSGIIARCKAFEFYQLPHRARSGELCCVKP